MSNISNMSGGMGSMSKDNYGSGYSILESELSGMSGMGGSNYFLSREDVRNQLFMTLTSYVMPQRIRPTKKNPIL